MHLLGRVALAIGLLAIPANAVADDDAGVTDPPMAPPPPPATAPPPAEPPAPRPVRAKRTKVGIDLALVLPLGTYADGNDVGAGGLLRFAYVATPALDVTLRAGYLCHKTDSDGLSMIPVLLGAAYKFGGGPFAYGELGVNLIRVRYTAMGFSATDGETYLSVGAGGGYEVGKVKTRLGFWMPGRPENAGTSDTSTFFGVLASVGVDFSAF